MIQYANSYISNNAAALKFFVRTNTYVYRSNCWSPSSIRQDKSAYRRMSWIEQWERVAYVTNCDHKTTDTLSGRARAHTHSLSRICTSDGFAYRHRYRRRSSILFSGCLCTPLMCKCKGCFFSLACVSLIGFVVLTHRRKRRIHLVCLCLGVSLSFSRFLFFVSKAISRLSSMIAITMSRFSSWPVFSEIPSR